MTTQDRAREAAAKALNTARLTKAEELRMEVPCFWLDPFESLNRDCKELQRVSANAAIDAFLSKSLEGADEKLAEIRKYAGVRKGISEFEVLGRHSKVVESHRDYLLTLVTALSAKLKEVEADNDRLHEGWKQAFSIGIAKQEEIEKLESQLTAQKAAHAKMLRDEADKLGDWPPLVSRHIRRLADEIEGEL